MPEPDLRDLYRDDYVEGYHREAGRRLERLLPLMDLSPDHRVADFGCGSGLLYDVVGGRVGRYHGIDFSREFIELARRRHAGGEALFECCSIEDFCAAHPREIDRAFALDFVEHVPDAELVPILAAIRGCLRADGVLYLHTPNRRFVLEALKEHGVMKQLPEHVAVRDATGNRALLERAGFREVEVHAIPHYVPALAWLHAFARVPGIGPLFEARLFLACRP